MPTNAEKLTENKDKLVLMFRTCLSLRAQLAVNIAAIEDCIGETDLFELIDDWSVGLNNEKEIEAVSAEEIVKALSEAMWFPHEE